MEVPVRHGLLVRAWPSGIYHELRVIEWRHADLQLNQEAPGQSKRTDGGSALFKRSVHWPQMGAETNSIPFFFPPSEFYPLQTSSTISILPYRDVFR